MCRQCFERSLSVYTPATDYDLGPDDDMATGWEEYDEWLDDIEYKAMQEEQDYD